MGLTGSVVKFVARYRALQANAQAAAAVQTAAISVALVMALLALGIYPLLGKVLEFSIPAESMPLALTILPWAVCSLWLNSVGGVFQSGLDGCQRMDIRNIVMIAGHVMLLLSAIWLVPRYGLEGLAIGQATQGLLLMVTNWLVLRQQLNLLPWFPFHWSKSRFKEMFGYAVNFQINSAAILLVEPVTKLLMSRYGGLSSAAYYEMANQLVLKLRALLIAATQPLAPAVAELHETSPGKVRELYLKSYRLLFFVAVPFFIGIWIALPLISILWIGYIESQFLLFGALLTAGWGLNSLSGIAYFLNIGTGALKWNSIAHVLMALLNVLLGFLLGPRLGELGVAMSAMIALIIASWLVVFSVHKQYQMPLRTIVPSENYLLLIISSICIAMTTLLGKILPLSRYAILLDLINIGVFLILFCIAIYFHPYKNILIEYFTNYRKKI